MSNALNNNNENEKKRNLKALLFSGITYGALGLIFVLVSWTHSVAPPTAQQPPADGGMEVNLGNSDQGWGKEAPQIPGDPAEETAEAESKSQPQQATAEEETTYKEVEKNDDADVPEVKTSPTPKHVDRVVTHPQPEKTNKPINKEPVTKAALRPSTSTVAKSTAPPQPVAKAVYKGGHGTGGNGADSYNGVRNQGIAGGHGDQGKSNGNPNSDSYNGSGNGRGGSGNGSGSSGVSIREGLSGRRLFSAAFSDKFNQNARVAVDVIVNSAGHVSSANINPRGTTTTDSNIRSIARRRAMQLKFSPGSSDTQTGTVVFNFKVRE